MKKAITSKKWLTSFLCVFLAAAMLVGIAVWLVDPFYQFRYRENSYIKNTAMFFGPGLVKNYDYDTLLLGSSMCQNFHMDVMRSELNCEPIHVGIGGIGLDEILDYIALSEKVGRCENYYIGLDQYMLATPQKFNTPEHLFRDDPLAVLRYMFSYEVCFRYLPLGMAMTAVSATGVELPGKFQRAMDIDYLGNWENDFTYGADFVIRRFIDASYSVSEVELDGLSQRMKENADKLFQNLPGDKSRYHIFFPPYSVLFWSDAAQKGYFEEYQDAKRYVLQRAEEYGIEVYDFQAQDFVSDLNIYKDSTHYGSQINDWMVGCFASGECLLDAQTLEENIAALSDAVDAFTEEYAWLFE